MKEIFVSLNIKGFEDCKISNFGRFMTHKGKIKKPEYKNNCWYIDLSKRKTINGKQVRADRLLASVPQLVYNHFGNSVPSERFIVRCIDGNPYNCRIDNLRVSIKGRTDKQIEKYDKEVLKCVKHSLFKSRWAIYQKEGFDIDNVIGNSCLLIWRYLGNYDTEKSFYSFCKKYVKYACKSEYKQSLRNGITNSMIN